MWVLIYVVGYVVMVIAGLFLGYQVLSTGAALFTEGFPGVFAMFFSLLIMLPTALPVLAGWLMTYISKSHIDPAMLATANKFIWIFIACILGSAVLYWAFLFVMFKLGGGTH